MIILRKVVLENRSAAVMGQNDKSPNSPVRGKDSAALPQAAAFFNVGII